MGIATLFSLKETFRLAPFSLTENLMESLSSAGSVTTISYSAPLPSVSQVFSNQPRQNSSL